VLRYALSPRWIPGHLIALALFVVCLRLAAWQWGVGHEVAPDGSEQLAWRNLVYAVQWVFFGGVLLWFWSVFLRDERRADLEWEAEHAVAESPG
jgi:hypothetical protein